MKVRRSRSFVVAGAISAVVAVVFAIFLLRTGVFVGAILLIASALFLLSVSIAVFGDQQPIIELADQGVILDRCNAVMIVWLDIESVTIERLPRAGRFLIIKLKSDQYGVLGKCRHVMTRHRDNRTEIILMAEGLSVPPGLIVNKMNEYLGTLN